MSIKIKDISPDFRFDSRSSLVVEKIAPHEGTPEAIKIFERHAWKMTDYYYWFTLGTLWVSYTGHSDIELWKRLFRSKRALRETSLMKPSESAIFRKLPDEFEVYRAHRPNEKDWIAYTLSREIVARFAKERKSTDVGGYAVNKANVIAIFLRRQEQEIIVIDKDLVTKITTIPVIYEPES